MELYNEAFPSLEINMKKSNSNAPKKLKQLKCFLASPNFTSSQIKAYCFFNKIEEKQRKNRENEANNNNTQINTNTDNLQNILKLSIDNYKTKKYISTHSKETIRKNNSIKVKQILDEIRRKTPKNLKLDKKYKPGMVNLSPENEKKKQLNIKFRNLLFKDNLKLHLCLISKKEKDKFFKRNIKNDIYNDSNTIKSYSQNKNAITSKDNNLTKKEDKNFLTPSVCKISASFDKRIKSNSFNISKHLNKKINEERLLTIEKNILNQNKEMIKNYPYLKDKNHLIKIKKFHKTKKFNFHELYKENNKLFKGYSSTNK